MPIYQNLYQTLLPCPIVELRGYLAACGLRGRLYAYLDYNGPTGTARDNLAAAAVPAAGPGRPPAWSAPQGGPPSARPVSMPAQRLRKKPR